MRVDRSGLGIARIWRGRTTPENADTYEAYLRASIAPLGELARGFMLLREDRAEETEFITISYWDSVEAMSSFAGDDPTRIHHLDRDPELLIELPDRVQVLQVLIDHPRAS